MELLKPADALEIPCPPQIWRNSQRRTDMLSRFTGPRLIRPRVPSHVINWLRHPTSALPGHHSSTCASTFMGAHVIVVTALLSSTALLQGWCLSPARVLLLLGLVDLTLVLRSSHCRLAPSSAPIDCLATNRRPAPLMYPVTGESIGHAIGY